MRIGELSAETGVPIRTIRYYEDIGVLAAPARTESGYRDYYDDVPDRLRFVKASQKAGLTLNEIRGIFRVREESEAPCEHVAQLIGRKPADVAEQWEALQLTKREMERLAARAERLDPHHSAVLSPSATSSTSAREPVASETHITATQRPGAQ